MEQFWERHEVLLAFILVSFALLGSVFRGKYSTPIKKQVVLYMLEDENEKPQCRGRVLYDRDANLGGFRTFLEGSNKEEEGRGTMTKANAIVPWPFDFWDSQLNARIATQLEVWNTLKMHGHEITVIKSHGGQSMAGKEAMAISKPTTVASLTISANEQSVSIPSIRVFQVPMEADTHNVMCLFLAMITRRASSNNSALHGFCVLSISSCVCSRYGSLRLSSR